MKINLNVTCESIEDAAQAIKALANLIDMDTPAAAVSVAPARTAAKPKPAADTPPWDGPTIDDVRRIMSQVIQEKGHDAAKAILAKCEAKNVSSIKPENFATAIESAKAALAQE